MSETTQPGGVASAADAAAGSANWDNLKDTREPGEFAAAWLDLLCEFVDANVHLGVVVLAKPGAGLAPVAVWPDGGMGTPAISAAIEAAIADRKPRRERHSVTFNGQPQSREMLVCPLLVDGSVSGAVALDVEQAPDDQIQQVVRQLGWAMVSLEALVRRANSASTDRLVTVLDLVATSLHYDRFQAAATAVATELAGILGCERVSIGFVEAKTTEVRALSHSASFGKKANIIRNIGACMDEAVDQQATVIYPPLENADSQVTRCHAELIRAQGEGAVCTVPFADGDKILGAITLERPVGERFDKETVKLCEHAASLLGPVLEVRRRDDRWLTSKALDSVKQTGRNLVGPQHTGLKITAAIAAFLLIFFTFAKGDYRVTADATLEGAVQRVVAVPISGFIAEANVRAGDTVKAGEVMFALDDRDLRLERLKWLGQKSQYRREYSEALAEHERARVNILSAQIEQAEAQIALVEEQLARINVTAPFDSFVVSGDLSQSLGAPVERGDILFEVAPLDSYRVILAVDERDIGTVEVGQPGLLALTGMPGETLPIEVVKVTPVSSAEEGRNYFEVEAHLTGDLQATLRPGMEGVGKVLVGEQKLIWIWTHKIGHWWRMLVWSWWP